MFVHSLFFQKYCAAVSYCLFVDILFVFFFCFIQQVVSLFKILYKNIYVYCFLLTIKFFIVVNYVDFFVNFILTNLEVVLICSF